MATATYIGTANSIAASIKAMYAGDPNNVARSISKGYIGDANNIARLFFDKTLSSGSKFYYKTTDSSNAYMNGTNDFATVNGTWIYPGGNRQYDEVDITYFDGHIYILDRNGDIYYFTSMDTVGTVVLKSAIPSFSITASGFSTQTYTALYNRSFNRFYVTNNKLLLWIHGTTGSDKTRYIVSVITDTPLNSLSNIKGTLTTEYMSKNTAQRKSIPDNCVYIGNDGTNDVYIGTIGGLTSQVTDEWGNVEGHTRNSGYILRYVYDSNGSPTMTQESVQISDNIEYPSRFTESYYTLGISRRHENIVIGNNICLTAYQISSFDGSAIYQTTYVIRKRSSMTTSSTSWNDVATVSNACSNIVFHKGYFYIAGFHRQSDKVYYGILYRSSDGVSWSTYINNFGVATSYYWDHFLFSDGNNLYTLVNSKVYKLTTSATLLTSDVINNVIVAVNGGGY